MHTLLAEKIIYPLGDLVNRSSVIKYYHWLQQSQWWDPERLQELQNTKLRALTRHAYENVPYYRKIFKDLGLTEEDIKTVDDLTKLPILTKKVIRQNFKDITPVNYKKCNPIVNYTGGSTGEPLKFYINKDVASIVWASLFRGWSWAGYKIGDKRISFGGSSLVPNRPPTKIEIIRQKLEKNLPLSAVSMNDAKYDKYVKIIKTYKPKFIYGYPSSIYLLALYCKSHCIDIRFVAVFTTAEVLFPHFRSLIQSQFQCEVFDQYGSYDGGGHALECGNHQGLHISSEKVILEIVDECGKRLPPGKPGRIIATDLYNYSLPFIRYEVGDCGILGPNLCPCGRGLPLLLSIEGRTPDVLRFSNGISLAGASIPCMFKDSHLKQFQLIQVAQDSLLLKLVKDVDYSNLDTEHLTNTLQSHVGSEINIELEFCEAIPVEQNNKYKFIVSME